MAHKNSFSSYNNSDDQLVLSYELLCLLRWLIEHDAERLKKVISKSLASGLNKEIQQRANQDAQIFDQQNVIEFFGLLEALMIEAQSELCMKTAYQKKLWPAIEMIDSSVDHATVRSTIEQSTTHIERNPEENPKEILLRELLKNWKPHQPNEN